MAEILTRLAFFCAAAEERAHELIELGVAGVEIEADGLLVCYLENQAPQVEEFVAAAKNAGFALIERREIADCNWSARCQELLAPVTVGRIRVEPFSVDPPSGKPTTGDTIRLPILVGNGFGSGHHESTRLALQLLQAPVVCALKPRRLLDVGTGSGILALAAAKLYNLEAQGIDIDERALDDALVNRAVNVLDEKVRFFLGTVRGVTEFFDVITANIYAEVLADAEPEFRRCLRPGACAILSGISAELEPIVTASYASQHWRLVQWVQEGRWRGFLYQLL